MSKFKILAVVVFIILGTLLSTKVKASTPDCSNPNTFTSSYDQQYCDVQKIKDQYTSAHETNKKDLAALQKQLTELGKKISATEIQIKNFENDISKREKELKKSQDALNSKAVGQYKNSRLYDPFWSVLSAETAIDAFRKIKTMQIVAEEDRKITENYSQKLKSLKNDKENLEKTKVTIASLKSQVAEKEKFLEGEVGKVESFLSSLSAKQQDILNAKSGGFTASVGDSDLADDINASIRGFRDSAPAGSFAVFSFGGYTHRKGMSQYGARGRAQNNQNVNQILKAYYGKEPVNKDTSGNIIVNGAAMNFEDYYLLGIAEMPSSWHPEALKAQAIAARTYAYRYKIEGKSICTDEGCQVFRKSKADSPPDAWKQAVQATRGQVLEDVVTYYSSTAGGYSTTSGWDTTDGSGGANFIDKAYEKLGGSPWLYKAWYRQGYTSSGATCGQNDPWLNNEEFTDIVNAAIVLKNGNDGRVSSTSTSCWGGNPYSYSELREKGGVSSVSSVSVTQGNGTTTNININGSINFTGDEFKQAFNLRAPGYLMIPQKGFAFFNIEKK